jgi:L-2,4-diaminobutyrate decarboxylase
MSDSNPILFSSAQSIEAYQQAIEQSTQAVMQWLKQPEMYTRQNGRGTARPY